MAAKASLSAFAMLLTTAACGCRDAGRPRLVSIGEGYAASTVNVTIFRQHAITTSGDVQYAAWYDGQGRLVLARRQYPAGRWVTRVTEHKGNVRDAHNVISIAVDGNGILHVSWDHHCHPLRYVQSTAPGSLELTAKMFMTGRKESRVTYPEFFNLADGDLLFLYRDGASGNGNTMLNRYDAKTRTWSVVQHPLIDGQGRRNAYTNQIAIDSHGVWHLSWNWRETPDVVTNHDLCYARSPDEGRTWYKSTGEQYALPITEANAEVIWAIPQNQDLINTTSTAVDSHGRPMLAARWRDAGADAPQYYLVWHDGRRWRRSQVGRHVTPYRLGGGGTKRIPTSRPKLAIDPRDRIYMFFRDEERGNRASVAICDDPLRRKWRFVDLNEQSLGRWEPNYDQVLWQRAGVFHLFVQHAGRDDAEAMEDAGPQTVSVLEWTPR